MIPQYRIEQFARRHGISFYAAAAELGRRGAAKAARKRREQRERAERTEAAFQRMRERRPDLW